MQTFRESLLFPKRRALAILNLVKITLRLCSLAISAALSLPLTGFSAQTGTQPPAQQPSQPSAKKKTATAPPSAQEIADAKGKGMVWVNTSTHVYHKDGSLYGTTKHGKFMPEDDAKKAGYRAASESGKAKAAPAK